MAGGGQVPVCHECGRRHRIDRTCEKAEVPEKIKRARVVAVEFYRGGKKGRRRR